MKKILILIIFVFGIILHVGCRNEIDPKEQKPNQKFTKSNSELNVKSEKIGTYVYGKSYKNGAKLSIGISEHSALIGGKPKDLKILTEEYGDSVSIFIPNLNSEKILNIHIWDTSYYRTRIFATPGDSIFFEIKNEKVAITGSHPEHYNFYLEMDRADNQYAMQPYKNDLDSYKKKIDSVFTSREKAFSKYVSKNKVSEKFIDFFKSELEYEALYNLLAPRTGIISGTETFYNSSLELSKYVVEERLNRGSDKLFNIESYLNNPKIEEFQNENYISNDYFKKSLSSIIRNYLANHEYLDYSQKNYNDEITYINNNLNGELQNMAKAKVVLDYYKKGFGKDSLGSIELRKTIYEIKKSTMNSSYAEEMDKISTYLDVLYYDIPEHILNEKLVSFKNDTILLRRILGTNKNKLVVFWGYRNRCYPCTDGINKLYELQKREILGSNIHLLYISVEDDHTIWSNEVTEFGMAMAPENSFKLVNDNMESKILSYFNVRYGKDITLPRYTVIDDKESVLHNNFVNPQDSLAFKEAIKKISIK